MIYTNEIKNHKLGHSTPFPDVAKANGWTIVFKDSEVERSDVDFSWYEKGYAPKLTDLDKVERARDSKKREAEKELTTIIAEITPFYPTDEKVSFAKQEEEALKYQANPEISESEIPCISGIARGRQMELSVLVQKILAKAALFSKMSGFYMGLKQRVEDMADAANTVEEIEAINVQEIFCETPDS